MDIDIHTFSFEEQGVTIETNYNSPHPGTVLYDFYIEPLDLPLQKLANAMCISKYQLGQICIGEAPITVFIAIQLAAYFGNSMQFWLNMQNSYNKSQKQ